MVLAAAARLWYSRMLQSAPFVPAPRNGPVVRLGEGPADRVLLFGNGPLHGWGVTQRELSVPGHLAQSLHRRSLRAVTVEYVGDERMNAASATAWLGDAAGRGHDVVLIALGMNDALRLTSVRRWRRQVVGLLDRVEADRGESCRVLLVGLPGIRRYRMADSWLGSIAQRRADAFTAVLRDLAGRDERTWFVSAPAEQFESDRPLGSSAMYRDWADEIAEHVLPHLDALRARHAPEPEEPDAWEWVGTPALLAARRAETVPEALRAVAEAAQERFGVAIAAVNLVDGSRTYFVAGAEGAPASLPKDLAYCGTTVQQDAPLVVLDARRDPRFRANPFLEVVRLPFYAGVPLRTREGRVVATLCLLDGVARRDFDPAALEPFARVAEQQLQAFDTDPSSGDLMADVRPADV